MLPTQKPTTSELAEAVEDIHMMTTGMGEAAVAAGAGTATGNASAALDGAERRGRASLICMGDAMTQK